ncbi:MAG: NADH-quinone oxidoreductase subunit C [Raineya sp.]
MSFAEIKELLEKQFGEDCILAEDMKSLQPSLLIATEKLPDVCLFLQRHEKTYFDFLACITGIDNGAEKATMEVLYHLYSIPYQHQLVLRVVVARNKPNEALPQVPSISHIWAAANWHERETYDLLGIEFSNHPDLRRILLPADWQGYPLRKDYQVQDNYHGIEVKYKNRN